MAVREVKAQSGRKIGTMASSVSGRAKDRPVDSLVVYGETNYHNGIRINAGDKVTVLSLAPPAVIEVVKGLLANLPDIYLAADDELLGIIKPAVGIAEADARAVNRVITERGQQDCGDVNSPSVEGLG